MYFMCLHDLQKAFDSVEIPVLHRLFQAGVNSKTWRLVQDWYTNCNSHVRVGCHNSSSLICNVVFVRVQSCLPRSSSFACITFF